MARAPKILVVEDDPAVSDVVLHGLTREGMEAEAVSDGERALELLRRDEGSTEPPFDLLILDVMLPGMDGVSVCRELRAESALPIIMLTARDDETSVVVGLEVGADDYVTKPFSPRQLASRVRAQLRRRDLDLADLSDRSSEPPEDEHRLRFPGLQIDLVRREVESGERRVTLTAKEFEVLSLLASHPGRVYSREQIMQHLWEDNFFGDARAADVHIRNIRAKIEPDPEKPRYLHTLRGVGYRFAEL